MRKTKKNFQKQKLAEDSMQETTEIGRGQHGEDGGCSDLKGFDDMGAHEGLLGVPSGLEGVVLAGLALLVLSLLEGGHQALHPLMHPHVGPLPPLPAPHSALCGCTGQKDSRHRYSKLNFS